MKRTKYGNIKVIVDGIRFDSKKEARRYGELKLLEKANLIDDLHLQVPFQLIVNDQKVGTYIADFVYIHKEKGKRVVEDAKGIKTSVYNLKKKLMKAIYNIEILET